MAASCSGSITLFLTSFLRPPLKSEAMSRLVTLLVGENHFCEWELHQIGCVPAVWW